MEEIEAQLRHIRVMNLIERLGFEAVDLEDLKADP